MDYTIKAKMLGIPVVFEGEWRTEDAAPAPGNEEASARIVEEIARLNRLTKVGTSLADSTEPANYRPFLELPGLLYVERLGLITDLKITMDGEEPAVY